MNFYLYMHKNIICKSCFDGYQFQTTPPPSITETFESEKGKSMINEKEVNRKDVIAKKEYQEKEPSQRKTHKRTQLEENFNILK